MNFLDIQLASRNIFRQGIRSSTPLFVVALSCFVLIIIGGFYQYLFYDLETSVVRSDGHVTLLLDNESDAQNNSYLNESLVARFESIQGVRIFALRSPITGVIGSFEKSSIFSGKAIDPFSEETLKTWPKSLDIQKEKQAYISKGASIGFSLAESLSLKEGDWFNGISGFSGFSSQVEKIIQTESEEKDRYYIELPFEALGGIDYELIESIHFQVKNQKEVLKVKDAIEHYLMLENINNYSIQLVSDSGGYIDSVKTIYKNNLLFIMIILSVTIFFAIGTTFTLSLIERTGELGTMQSFGAQKKHLSRLFLLESSFISVYGFVLGAVLAVVVGLLINKCGGIRLPPPPTMETSITVGFLMHPIYFIQSLAIVFLVGQLSVLRVIQKIKKLSVIDLLRLNT